jgi:ClpX C4-type zinc finger
LVATADLSSGPVCTFCLKPSADVETMVAGPGVYICNECVDLCNQIIASMPESNKDPDPDAWRTRFSDDELLAFLPKIASTSTHIDQQLTRWVREARSRGMTWTRIGESLGMTRQSAWERFSGED